MSPDFETITSFQNSKVKLIKKLRDRQGRDREKRFVIDDWRDLERAIEHGYRIDYAFYCPALSTEDEMKISHLSDKQIYHVSREMIEKVSYRQNPSSILAVLHQKPRREADDLNSVTAPLILGLVNLQKPGNIGALMRTADAAGFQVIFLIDTALDLYNPNILRSSTGACFLDNVYQLTSAQALNFFQDAGYSIIAAAVDGEQQLYDVHFGQKSAIILGAEDQGLDALWLENADHRVKIPMSGKLSDSLNVSVSGAIFMYEALRQLRNYT